MDGNEATAETAEVLAGPVVEVGGEIVKGAEGGDDDDDCVVEVDEAILRDLGPKQLKAMELMLRGEAGEGDYEKGAGASIDAASVGEEECGV